MALDLWIIEFLNGYARSIPRLDLAIDFIAHNTFLKGGVLMIAVYWLWFQPGEDSAVRWIRENLVALLIAGLVSLFVARTLALTLPFRPRPVHAPDLDFVLPSGASARLETWSSFPSDHAVLFFAIATSLWLTLAGLNRRLLGALIGAYVIVAIFFPRVYVGLHYPTDILVGASIGFATALLFAAAPVRNLLSRHVLSYEERSPGLFYAGFFVVTSQIAIMFDPFRDLIAFVIRALRAIVGT